MINWIKRKLNIGSVSPSALVILTVLVFILGYYLALDKNRSFKDIIKTNPLPELKKEFTDLGDFIKEEEKVNLSHKEIIKVPDELFKNRNMKTLDLSFNKIQKIPTTIGDALGLEELNLSDNILDGALPSQIQKLKKLRILNVSKNNMTGIPAEIGQLNNLEVLNYSDNKLDTMPMEIKNLKNLKELNLSENQYRSIPNEIKEMKWLKALDLTGNQINIKEIDQLKKLMINTTIIY